MEVEVDITERTAVCVRKLETDHDSMGTKESS
jgi:hypothetical protein